MKRAAWLLCLAAAPAIPLPALALPSFDAVKAAHRPSDVELQDRHGAPLQVQRVDARVRRGAWMPLDQLSPSLRTAIVLSEDRRFWEHGGVDWPALAAAAWASAWNGRTRGASTVTMQLAALLQPELQRPRGGRSLGQKIDQAAAARELEDGWRKTQILEAYLNLVPLRGDAVGVPAAAWALFGKRPAGLDAVEAAILAALVRAPNAAAPAVVRRACELLRQQQRGCEPLAGEVERAFARRPGAAPGEQLAPHFARQWKGGPRTTLDAALQRLATATLRRQLAELRGRNVEDGAVVVLDNASGEVLAWVGSSGPLSAAGEVDAVLARRQPGSTLKPFVYALAFERGLLGPDSRLDDAPLEVAAGSGLYTPQNYDRGHQGVVSVRSALGASLNVPAVRVGTMLGPDALFDKLQQAGLALQQNAGFHGPALALGSAEVTLLDLANAYRALANGGRWSPVAGLRGGTGHRIFDAAAAWQVADILADPAARAPTFGFDSPLVTRGWAAVKTGTSKDLRDNWCIGFSDRYTVGVWVGNAGGAPMHGVSGSSGAAPVWRELMAWLHEGRPSKAPRPPPGLRALPVRAGVAGRFGIQTPREGSVIVLDPEIPHARQRLVFEGAAGQWRVNGQAVGQGERVAWRPRPGRHVLEREGEGGRVDRVAFEVRLAPGGR